MRFQRWSGDDNQFAPFTFCDRPGERVERFNANDVENIRFNGRNGNHLFINRTDIDTVAFCNRRNDRWFRGRGDDFLSGSHDEDVLKGHEGNDRLFGGNDDLLYGWAGHDLLNCGDGNDELWGGADNDTLIGWRGNDILHGDTGNDWLHGGEGRDSYSLFEANDEGYDPESPFASAGVDRDE